MYTSHRLLTAALIGGGSVLGATAPTSFIGAEGFGASALGGRFGDVYHVTNLNNSGAGSLRYGIDNAPSVGRTIVFDVGGWIDLDSKLGITKNKITIAGQTAPGGIGVRGDQFSIGGDDIVIRHMRFRPGKGAGRVDGAGANINANRVIYDHVSVGFSYDENFSTQADNLTLQYSSVSFGMQSHSAGSLIENGAGHLSFHHNVYANNHTRNPKARAEVMDWRDNIAFNYHNGFIAGDSQTTDFFWRANFDGNTYITDGRPMITGGRDFNYGLYFGENAYDGDGDSAADPQVLTRTEAMGDQSIVSSSYTWETEAYEAPEVWQQADAASAYEWTLSQFGATPWARDDVDQLTEQQIRTRSGTIVSHERDLGVENDGYPTLGGVAAPVDTDRDGMPDAWERDHGLDPAVDDHLGDFDDDGYTNLEEYLGEIAAIPAPDVIEFKGTSGRYAEAQNWAHNWQPSSMDSAKIGPGVVEVDAIGQRAGDLEVSGNFLQSARLQVTEGRLEVEEELSVGTRGEGGLELSGGMLEVQRLTVGINGYVAITGGTLDAKEVGFDLVNNGATISPGDGLDTMLVEGDFQLLSGSLLIDVSDEGADRVVVEGTATLGGALVLDLPVRYSPTQGDKWLIVDAEALVGAFTSVPDGFHLTQEGGDLYLVAGDPIPEPSAMIMMGLAGIAMKRRH